MLCYYYVNITALWLDKSLPEYQVVLTRFFRFLFFLHIYIQYNFLTFLSTFEQKIVIIHKDIKLLKFVIS